MRAKECVCTNPTTVALPAVQNLEKTVWFGLLEDVGRR
jgi:hypothetical protein